MNVLVAYATRHGSTGGIAERIAAGLREASLPAEARSVDEVRDIAPYDAFVIGGAAYMFHWLDGATRFVKKHRAVLAERPVWLFSSGPIGPDLVDKDGNDVLVTTRPKEWPELIAMVRPRGDRVFFGAWDPSAPPVGMAERLMHLMPASARNAMPAGDFRDWPAIDAWAAEIAGALQPVPV
jgi:menaquinone-dependent protoporphyrinogen oxidase